MISAIILAGGKGKRMGSAISKQFIDIKGKPIIYYTLKKFSENKKIDNNKIKIVFDEPQRAITKGQSVVMYNGDVVVGGGIIC